MAQGDETATVNLLEIRDLVVSDLAALDKWPAVVDHIVKCAGDQKRIKKLLKDHEYDEGVKQSLQLWHANGTERVDLLQKLRDYNLNSLADAVKKLEPCTQSRTSEVWFEVGEVVYNFTGRGTEIEVLHKMLTTTTRNMESSIANLICIRGLGGIGKSTLARKYAFIFSSYYEGNVIWINGETMDSMRASFMRLANSLHIGIDEKAIHSEIAKAIYAKLRHQKKCLFIFDNVEEKLDFDQFRPTHLIPNSSLPYVLITTRRNDLTPIEGNQLNLEVLSTLEAVQFIQKQLPNSTVPVVTELAEKLERFPLALQQALAFIRDKYIITDKDDQRVTRYLKEFNESEKAHQILADTRFQEFNDYSRTTFTTWQITLERISSLPGGESAHKVIQVLAYLNPDNISVEFLTQLFQHQWKGLGIMVLGARPDIDIEAGLKLLEKFCMVTLSLGKVRIHRLVQHVIRLSLSSGQVVLTRVLKFVEVKLQRRQYTAFGKECVSHGLHLFAFQHKEPHLMASAAGYLAQLCHNLLKYGNYSECLTVARTSASIYLTLYGADHENTLYMDWRTASALYWLQDYTEAMSIYNEVSSTLQMKFGEQYWLSLLVQASIARIYSAQGDHNKAIAIYDRIIPLQTRLHGADDQETLLFTNDKAMTLFGQGKLDDALELYQFVHKTRLKKLGSNHLRTLEMMREMADVLFAKRETHGALEMYREVYEGFKQMFGEEHPYTLKSKAGIDQIENRDQTDTG